MSVFLWKAKLTYVSVPKVACTSIKRMFFEIENGVPFSVFRSNGHLWHIHEFYKGLAFPELPHRRIAEHRRLAVLRDPVQRVLSCYSNRVLYHGKLSVKALGPALARAGLAPAPDLGEFVDRFEEYRAVSPDVLHHSQPLVHSLGDDPGFYAKVYDIRDLATFVADVGAHLGRELQLGRHQTGGPKFRPEDLTQPQRDRLMQIFAEDYRVWGRHF